MGIVVLKFGGTSVADKDKLLNVCRHVIKEYETNNKVVVVVSAQGKTTDKLILEENEITTNMMYYFQQENKLLYLNLQYT